METRAQQLLMLCEAFVHRVIAFRHGHRTTIKTCQPGYRKVGGSCHRMNSMERYHIRKGHKYAARKNKIHQSTIQRHRARTLLRRSASGL